MFKKILLNIFVSVTALIVLFVIVYIGVLLPWHTHWGASAAETAMPLPGDEMIAAPKCSPPAPLRSRRPLKKYGHGLSSLVRGAAGCTATSGGKPGWLRHS